MMQRNKMCKRIQKGLALAALICMVTMGAGCAEKKNVGEESVVAKHFTVSDIPEVTYENQEIYINGKYIMTADNIYVNRLDAQVISIYTSQGPINLTADGEPISLDDVIVDKRGYEKTAGKRLEAGLAMRNSIVRIDTDKAAEQLSSFEKAKEMPFLLNEYGVQISYQEESGGESIRYEYDESLVNPKYRPSDNIEVYSCMRGRLGYDIEGLLREEYADHWVENSVEIQNYNGKTYYWFCVAYKDEAENKTYYSVVAEEMESEEENKAPIRKVIYSEKVDGPFACCNIREFGKIIPEELKD